MADLTRIGLDLDNTIIDYSNAYSVVAQDFDLPANCRDRASIRKRLRVSPPDDLAWQQFQAILYSQGLDHADPSVGLNEFLGECRSRGVRLFIISHKTSRTPAMFGAVDLRTPAMEWLVRHDIVPGFVKASDVHFCSTRAAKVQSIIDLKLGVFIDDLKEVLEDPRLPASLVRWLFVSRGEVTGLNEQEFGPADFPKLYEWLRGC